MNRKAIRLTAAVLASMLLVNSCEFESYEDFGIQPYDGELTFNELSKKAEWKNRFDHAAVYFDSKVWIFGGYNPGEVRNDTYYEDVWSSEDGISWTLVTADAPWKGRRGHGAVVFDDGSGPAMFIIGGYSVDEETGYRQYCNDVWKSTDGENWTLIKECSEPELENPDTWYPRMNHAVVVAKHGGQDYLYIIGGRTQLTGKSGTYSQEYFNDVWRSTDGINWTSLPNDDYGIRASHAAAVDPDNGTIYIQGGMHGIIFEAEDNASHPIEDWNKLWSSPDGIHWAPSYDSIVPESYLERSEHEMAFYQGSLWVFPGATTSTMHYHFAQSNHYPTWKVNSDNVWTIDSEGSDLRGRHSYGFVADDEKIWFLGGFTSNNGQDNDVWTAEL